jgi:hypothetical protein
MSDQSYFDQSYFEAVRRVLHDARARYEEAPSHASAGTVPRAGTVCAATAFVGSQDPEASVRAQLLFRGAAGVWDTTQVIEWNAASSTEEVLAAFDRAIEACS